MASKLNPEYLEIPELASDPTTPSAGNARLYVKNDNTINLVLDSGTVIDLTSGGASALSDLTDTNISSISDGDMLKYASSPGEWQNVVPVISDMSDVNVVTPSDGEALIYNQGSTEWQNQAVATDVESLSDVTVTTEEQGDMLVRGAAGWINAPMNPSVFAYLDPGNVTPMIIHSNLAPNGGLHLLDLDDSFVLHESLGSVNALTAVSNNARHFRTPIGADNAIGLLTGLFWFSAANYAGTALFRILINDIAVGDFAVKDRGETVWDSDPSGVYTPDGTNYVLPISYPLYGGTASGPRMFPISITNLSGDAFQLTWRLMVHWTENQS